MGDLVLPDPPRKHPGGRPTLYRQEIADAICEKLRLGITKRAACALANVDEETFRWWCDTRPEFLQMVVRADAEAEGYYTESIHKAAGSVAGAVDYRAGVEWLKRRRRADYGDTLDVRRIDTAQLLQLLQANTEQTAIPAVDPGLLEEEDVL